MKKVMIEYIPKGVCATIKVNGVEMHRVRSFKFEHDVDGLPIATIEIANPEAHITALGDVVYRNVTLKGLLRDWWRGLWH